MHLNIFVGYLHIFGVLFRTFFDASTELFTYGTTGATVAFSAAISMDDTASEFLHRGNRGNACSSQSARSKISRFNGRAVCACYSEMLAVDASDWAD